MRDLNSLYSEYLINNIHRERREQSRVAEATAGQLSTWQRLMNAIRAMRPARTEPVREPKVLACAETGSAS